MWMTTLWMASMFTIRPYYDPTLNKLEFVNELFYNLTLFLSFTFTELLPDMTTKTSTGYVFIAVLASMITVNVVVQLIDFFKKLSLNLKKTWMKIKRQWKKWQDPPRQPTGTYLAHSQVVHEYRAKQHRERMKREFVSNIKELIHGKVSVKASTASFKQKKP